LKTNFISIFTQRTKTITKRAFLILACECCRVCRTTAI